MRKVTVFLFPGAGMLVLALVAGFAELPADWQGGVRSIYPVVVLSVGLILGWRFHRSRLLLALLVLTLCDRALVHVAALDPAALDARVLFNGVAILLPINLAFLALAAERGIFSLRGVYRLIVIGLQVAAIALMHTYAETRTLGPAARALADMPTPLFDLPAMALLAFGGGLATMLFGFYQHRSATESGFFWALLITLIGVWPPASEVARTAAMSTAGLTLVLSLVEASYGMAFRDELTGLPGRRALQEALIQLTGDYTIAMVDIDHFKKFNDRFGHDVGDQVLKMVAARLERIRGGGKSFRYGGEEFTVLFRGKDAEDAAEYLDAARKEIGSMDFVIRAPGRPRKRPDQPRPARRAGRRTHITVSAGAAERNNHNSGPDDVLRAADKALYKAKETGRNRVCL
ncbi:MAG: GGDEF domain-containing protein [Lentisphaerae bacterium]|nr:GGDEF domain-containing protein [Lentisphaerota bacterium]